MEIESQRVDSKSKPISEVNIANCGELIPKSRLKGNFFRILPFCFPVLEHYIMYCICNTCVPSSLNVPLYKEVKCGENNIALISFFTFIVIGLTAKKQKSAQESSSESSSDSKESENEKKKKKKKRAEKKKDKKPKKAKLKAKKKKKKTSKTKNKR